MHGHKVFAFLETFTSKELLDFEKFLGCAYFGSRKKVADFYSVLKKKRKEILDGSFTKEKISEKLYGENKFNKNTFNDLCAQLLHHAEEFLYIESARNNTTQKEIFLMHKYLERGYSSLFENKKEKVFNMFENELPVDSNYFNLLYDANIHSLNYRQIYKKIKSRKDSDFILEGIVKATTNLLNYFLLETAGNYFDTFARQNIFTNNTIAKDFEKFTQQLFKTEFLEPLKKYNEHYYMIEVYKNMIDAFIKSDNNLFYFRYKSSVNNHIKKFSISEIHFHYSKLTSYCALRLNRNKYDDEFRKESSSICREIITHEYYKNTSIQFLLPDSYFGFLNNFFHSKDTDSIVFLIEKCIPLMEKKYAEFYRDFSWANYHFLSGNYSQTLDCLNKLEVPFFGMNFRVKTLIIRSHYHIGNTEQALNSIDTYLKFLSSDKGIPKNHRVRHEKFAKFARKIVIYSDKGKYDELSYLNSVIQKTPDVFYRDWLIETIEEILTKKKIGAAK